MTGVEVCTATVEDSAAAAGAGASRIELNSALEAGGLSPSPGLLQAVISAVSIPVVVMVRPVSGGFHYSRTVKDVMLRDMASYLELGADGLVFGALSPGGSVDMQFVEEVRREFPDTVLVFSRAFDLLENPLPDHAARLAGAGVDRILTSGGKPTAREGISTIRSLAGRGIQILPGSGISSSNVLDVVRGTGCRWVHGSFTAGGSPAGPARIVPAGFPPVNAGEVRRTVEVLGNL